MAALRAAGSRGVPTVSGARCGATTKKSSNEGTAGLSAARGLAAARPASVAKTMAAKVS